MNIPNNWALKVWGLTVGEEARKTFDEYIKNGFFATFMGGEKGLDSGSITSYALQK